MDIKQKIIGIIAGQMSTPKENINLNSNIETDLGVDSLDLVFIVMEIEDKCNVYLTNEQALEWNTVGDIIKDVEIKF